MYLEKKYGYSGDVKNTRVDLSERETRFTAVTPSQDANYWVSFTMDAPIKDTYIMIPACSYDGNRFRAVHRPYPPSPMEEDLRKCMEPFMTEVPRLSPNGDSFMDVTAGDMATPCVCIYQKHIGEAILLFFEQGNHGLNHGLTLEQKGDSLEIKLMAPAKRRLVYRWYQESEDGKMQPFPSLRPNPEADIDMSVNEGEETVITHRIYQYPCKSITQLYRYFFEKRNELYQGGAVAELPFSAYWKMAKDLLNELHFYEEYGFYSLEALEDTNRIPSQWQPGWVGGGLNCVPLHLEDDLSRSRAIRTLEFATRYQSDIGFYYAHVYNGKTYHDYAEKDTCNDNMNLMRRHADLTYFMFKQFDIIRKSNQIIPQNIWKSAVMAADAIVNVWMKYGELGQFVNTETGELVVKGSASGGIAPAALCAAAQLTGKMHYLDYAREIARYYYKFFICKGVTTGGPAEALQAPDSESITGLLESFITLYEMEGTEEWLDMSRDAAHQLASWVVSYDYQFPKESKFGKLGIHAAGSVWANVQNKHSAPGLCTHSPASLLKLYRATKEKAYLELMQQIAHFMPQVASRPDRPIYRENGQPMRPSEMCERVNTSDWEGNNRVGDSIFGPCSWPEISMILTWFEVPGIYVSPEEGLVCVSDHVNAWLEKGKLVVENPTVYPACIRVLIENDEERKKMLGLSWQDHFFNVEVKAGERITLG